MQELIDEMKDYSYKVSKEGNLDMVAAFDYAIGIAKKYKEKEKQQIIYAYIKDRYVLAGGHPIRTDQAEYHYNQTYNQDRITISETKSSIEGIGLNNQNK